MSNLPPRQQTHTQSGPIRAIPYVRVSMAREETISPQIQLDAIKSWSDRRDRILVGDPISEEGVSGTTFKRRIMEAIERIESGEADEILVWKFSRFGRNTLEFAVNLDRVEKAGGRLVSVTEDVDAETATGQFTRDMLIALASMESKRISEGWKEAQAIRLSAGLPHTATPRFGYVHHKCDSQEMSKAGWRIRHTKDLECRTDGPCGEEYRLDPETSAVLADLYRRYIDGEGLATLAKWCNDTGQPRDRKGKWWPSSVADALDSGFGAGLLRVGVRSTKGRPDKNDSISYLPGSHPAVIDSETWQDYLVKRRANNATPSSLKRSAWPLTGLIRCGLCGETMTCAGSARGAGYMYRCKAMQNLKTCPGVWRTREAIETEMFRVLEEVASDLPERARRLAPTVRRQRSVVRRQRRSLEQELADVATQKKRVVEQVMRGTLTNEDVAQQMEELRTRTAQLSEQLAATDVPARPITPVMIRDLRTDWPTLPVETARTMARLLIRRIDCHSDKSIQVHLAEVLVNDGSSDFSSWSES